MITHTYTNTPHLSLHMYCILTASDIHQSIHNICPAFDGILCESKKADGGTFTCWTQLIEMFLGKRKKEIKRGKVSNAHQHLISEKEDRRIQDIWGNWRMEIAKTDVRNETQIGRQYLNCRLKKNWLYKLWKHRGRKLRSDKQHIECVDAMAYACQYWYSFN